MTNRIFVENGVGGLKFVGDFEGLYAESPDPWDQSGQPGPMASYYAISRARLSDTLSRRLPLDREIRGLEIGCGHGHTLNWLSNSIKGEWIGIDISALAINKAKKLYPKLSFSVVDITSPYFTLPMHHTYNFDVVILSQALWYVLHKIKRAVFNMHSLCSPGGLFVISQGYFTEKQRYGAEIADGFGGTLGMMLTGFPEFQIIEASYEDSGDHALNDGLILARRR